MYKSKHIIGKRNGKIHRFALFFTVLMLLCGVLLLFPFTPSHVSADEDTSVNRLQNGSFEDGPTFSDKYSQPDQKAVPGWNTTAFEGKIELFKENTNTYIQGVTLKPSDGTYAAELNADEESTLYQNVSTSPSSVYEWGLDHGARNGTDTMALVIGPKQSVDPSKPSKDGRDQLMQMVDWLIAQNMTSVKTSAGLGEQLTVYSKKFAAKGTFEDNAGNNPFSLTPSAIYTEEWHIWIMASSKTTSGTNPWNSYGTNAESSAGSSPGSSQAVDLSKYYLYTVPSGQTVTLFGFVSVGCYQSSTTSDKAKTFGNFLDNINFQIYHPLSGSTTTHGSAVIGGSDGTTGGAGSSDGHQVTIDNKLTTYVVDGEPLKIQAIVKKADADDGCEFVGVHHTKQAENGNPVTEFLRLAENEIEDTGSLTDEQKAGKWVKSTNANGDTIYNYYLDNLTSATDLHFVFIKSPTVTYDPNGGKPYEVEREHNTDEAANVYSFKPASGAAEAEAETNPFFIEPYVSHAADGQNDGWKFMGWRLIGDVFGGDLKNFAQVNADKLGSLILPAEHTIACDYTFGGVDRDPKAQYFKIYDGKVSLTEQNVKDENGKDVGVTWNDNSETKAYANVHKGLTMVAQWRWRQAFIPQVYVTENSYSDSAEGGTVEITSVTDTSDENYNAAYNENGGKSYHAATGERVTLTATAKEGYGFVGWYDERGKLVATNAEYSYVETQESVKTYYARFLNSVTQTYIRQVRSGDSWTDITDDKIGTLGRYTYTDVVGMPISSTATAGSGYKFMGWYDSEGNKVADNMLINDGATISYKTTGNATYYARFSNSVTQTYIRQVGSGDNWKNTNDDTIGTLTHYSQTNTADATVSSQATAGKYYEFVGWYASDGRLITKETTISGTITEGATYYARFSKKIVTQTFIRQVKNGDSWEVITDDTIGTLTKYIDVGEIDNPVSSKATAGSGYRFVGWYDSAGNDANKVINDMLTEKGMTISYTTTDNATYYARFEKAYTLNVSKIDGDQSTDENKVPLAGAEFTLYQADENGEQTIVYEGASIKCTAVRISVTALNAEGKQATAVFTDTLSPDSEYYLAETKAPTGYRLLDAPLKITVYDSGNIALIDGIEKNITEHEVNVELANYLTLHMPTSGTPFTGGLFAVTGLSLLTLAAIGLFWFKISRYKSKRNNERKIHMKTKKFSVLLFTLILALGLFPMGVFAASSSVTPTSTASITINNAVENDVLKAYKVVDITYDATSNHVSYGWNSAFADYFAQTNSVTNSVNQAYTVEQFAALTADSDDLKNLLAGLPKYITDKNIAVAKTATVGEGGTATFADLAMGEYFIRPSSTTSVYQLMLQKIEPTAVSGTYKIDDVSFSAKHREVTIDKTADKTSVTKNEKVAYTVAVDIPTYANNTTDKSFYVSDLLPDGLTIDTASINVKIGSTTVDTAAYTLDTTATSAYTFKLSVSTQQYTDSWTNEGGKKLVITYTATLNDNATTEVNNKETNKATFDYSFYPYVENSHKQKTDTVDVTTFAIKIDKYVAGSPTTKLANAKFDLYRTATDAEITAGGTETIPHTTINGIKLESDVVTNASGVATFEKYEANGTKYDYYLVETQAPDGYNILANAVQVNFTDADVVATNGVYTVEVSNSSGITLPITGDEGIVIFTVIGIALMAGAVILFVLFRKKAKAK